MGDQEKWKKRLFSSSIFSVWVTMGDHENLKKMTFLILISGKVGDSGWPYFWVWVTMGDQVWVTMGDHTFSGTGNGIGLNDVGRYPPLVGGGYVVKRRKNIHILKFDVNCCHFISRRRRNISNTAFESWECLLQEERNCIVFILIPWRLGTFELWVQKNLRITL